MQFDVIYKCNSLSFPDMLMELKSYFCSDVAYHLCRHWKLCGYIFVSLTYVLFRLGCVRSCHIHRHFAVYFSLVFLIMFAFLLYCLILLFFLSILCIFIWWITYKLQFSRYLVAFSMMWYLNQRVMILPPRFEELQFGGYLKSGECYSWDAYSRIPPIW